MKSLLVLVFAVLTVGVSAQDLKQEVDVTRDYSPTVERAQKRLLSPDMVDTVALNPDIDYAVNATTLNNPVGVEAFSAAKISDNLLSSNTPLFVKLGMGFPLNSLAELHYGKSIETGSLYGAYMRHKGYWSKVKNDLGYRVRARDVGTTLGAYGKLATTTKKSLDGRVEFENSVVDRYGFFELNEYPNASIYDQLIKASVFNSIGGDISWGDDFQDLSRFNYRIGMGGYSFVDKENNGEGSYNAFAEIGKDWGSSSLTLKVLWSSVSGVKGVMKDYQENTFTVSPRYELSLRKFRMKIGADFVNNNNFFIYPYAQLTFNVVKDHFIPYVELSGGLTVNSYRETVKMNPYVAPLAMPNTSTHTLKGGIMGNLSKSLYYKAFAGTSFFKDRNWFVNEYQDQAYFSYVTDNGSVLDLGGVLNWDISRRFTTEFAATYHGYGLDKLPNAIASPVFDSELKIKYKSDEKFVVSVYGIFQTPRTLYTVVGEALHPMKTKTTVDFGADINIKAGNRSVIFVSATNILGAKLYPFGHYPGQEATFCAGVMMNF